MEPLRTVESLIKSINAGNQHQYLYFWGHKGKKGFYSQWYMDAPFKVDGILYKTAEHWMMAHKAKLFNDDINFNAALAVDHPGDTKDIGRAVRGFDNDVWTQHRFDIVVRGNVHKFSQHPHLLKQLLETGDKVLVEASPFDHIWGIKLGAADPRAHNPKTWRGQNLLGFALMEVRERLRGSVTR